MTRVLIVEDQKMAQENMEAIVQSSEDYILAGTISNAADAELVCISPLTLFLWTYVLLMMKAESKPAL